MIIQIATSFQAHWNGPPGTSVDSGHCPIPTACLFSCMCVGGEKVVPMPDCITMCANVDTRVKYHVPSFGDKGFTELSALRIFLCNSSLHEVRDSHNIPELVFI